jgi:hypothetical protein
MLIGLPLVGGQFNQEFALGFWSQWFSRESSHSAQASTAARTLTVGEVVAKTEHASSYLPAQRCLLCEARATVLIAGSEARIRCAACGEYVSSLEAGWALDALVTYRGPALAQMRKMLGEYRESMPSGMPKFSVQYVVSDGVPTFSLIGD